ncbi:MAG: toprim domain-containing protein [Chitinophagales bacterium]
MSSSQEFSDIIVKVKSTPIEDVLASFGHYPQKTKKGGKQLWYNSPFMERKQKTPSFVIDTIKNTWGDFAVGALNGKIGGDVLDLVQKYKNVTFFEAVTFIQGKPFLPTKIPRNIENDTSEIKVKKVQFLQNKALIGYLKDRSIDVEIAKLYLEEIYYYQGIKHYFSLAFKNRSDGYEIRNKYFKGCIGKKDVTIVYSNSSEISVFEGFSDFLSVLTYKSIKRLKTDVLILNSTALLPRVMPLIQTYQKSYTFLDNDPTGSTATKQIKQVMPTKTMNYLYENYNDFNDFLTKSKTK